MGKVIITGPGRAGTTSLMRILTRLNYDTGYTIENEDYRESIRAGMEIMSGKNWGIEDLRINDLPTIIKDPNFSFFLKPILQNNILEIDYVIMPIRDYSKSAQSRLNAGLNWNAKKLENQIHVHQLAVAMTVEACALHDVPLLILGFPKHVEDSRYCFNKLCRVFKDLLTKKEKFIKAFKKVNEL